MLLRAYRDGTDPTRPDGWFSTGDVGRSTPRAASIVDRPPGRPHHHRRRERLARDPSSGCSTSAPASARSRWWVGPIREWGQRVVALVVPADPRAPPSLDDLRATVTEQLPACATRPRRSVAGPGSPARRSGKVRRADLQLSAGSAPSRRSPESVQEHPAVDHQRLTGDPRGQVAGQERGRRWRCRRAHPVGAAGTARASGSSFGSHRARAMSVFTRPGAMAFTRTAGRQLGGQGLGEVDQRRLGDVVDADRRLDGQATDRGDVDDTPPCCRPSTAPGLLGPHQRAPAG